MTTLRAAWAVLPIVALSACRHADWPMYGRTYDDHRFSPLHQVNEHTVGRLELAWSRELDTTRGLEASPLEVDGVLYFTGSWSVVYAVDARSGALRWIYDPKVPRERSMFICCDVVNRGVALDRGKVYAGTLDGRLIALDQRTGRPVWVVQTVDSRKPYSITSAPRIARGMVVIGNGGAEYGVRGSVSAFDADTGKLVWRFFTVPGDPSKGFETEAMERAAKTWSGEWWKTGGGGTAWEGIAYDPALDLLYFGTGNPTAWYRALRGAGDNLYTGSIVALHAASGELAWYFQTTPGDNWDYDATQPLLQADLRIGGRLRQTILQANKNGFFYVLDRQTGEFLSGTPFVDGITWASGLDPKNGRPIETHDSSGFEPFVVSPSSDGAHNWNPMAFSPATGLVYLAAKANTVSLAAPDGRWKYDANRDNVGEDESYNGPLLTRFGAPPRPSGELLAWDPAARKAAWKAPYPVVEGGGVLATAGNLVFQGRADGVLAAWRATDGKLLWTFDTGTGIMAPPVTYMLDGVQYVSVLAGWGGPSGLFNGPLAGAVRPGYGRILAFKLGGTAALPARPLGHAAPPESPTAEMAEPALVKAGGALYGAWCARCHGWNALAGPLPDLRYSSRATLDRFEEIVLGGSLAAAGMPSFRTNLNAAKVRAIRAFVMARIAESGAK